MWNLEGLAVAGVYLSDIPVRGKVIRSRVKYGGGIQHTVQLDHSFDAGRGIKRESGEYVLIDHSTVTRVMEAV